MDYRNSQNVYKKYNKALNSYNNLNTNYQPDVSICEVPVNTDVGYIDLFVFTQRGIVPVKDAVVKIFVRQGDTNSELIKQTITEEKPIFIELPVAHPAGSLIRGPEYYFTTYDMKIEKEGYYSILVKNIRIFPTITTQFNYHLNPVLPGVPGQQKTISIPPHPRDQVI